VKKGGRGFSQPTEPSWLIAALFPRSLFLPLAFFLFVQGQEEDPCPDYRANIVIIAIIIIPPIAQQKVLSKGGRVLDV